VGWLLPFKEMTNEIAARTQPNTPDLAVALFSGEVGSMAICGEVSCTAVNGRSTAPALSCSLKITAPNAPPTTIRVSAKLVEMRKARQSFCARQAGGFYGK
jgi:hypothetical protein